MVVGRPRPTGRRALSYPPLASYHEDLLDIEEMHHASLLLPKVVMVDHVCSLAAEDPDVVGVVVAPVPVDMMDDLPRQKRSAQLPLGHRPVLIVGRVGARVEPLLIAVKGKIKTHAAPPACS